MCFCAITRTTVAVEIEPVPVILDTDMGNDIDDVFELGVLHALHSRGECRIVAEKVSMDHLLSVPFCDVLNNFFGRPNISAGVLRTGKSSSDGPYLLQVMKRFPDVSHAFPNRLQKSSDAPLAVPVLRKGLAGLRDGSTVVIAIGPLNSRAETYHSSIRWKEDPQGWATAIAVDSAT